MLALLPKKQGNLILCGRIILGYGRIKPPFQLFQRNSRRAQLAERRVIIIGNPFNAVREGGVGFRHIE